MTNEEFIKKTEEYRSLCEADPKNSTAWKAWALLLCMYMEETHTLVTEGVGGMTPAEVFSRAAEYEAEDAEEKITTRRNRTYKKLAAGIVKGKISLYDSVAPMITDGRIVYSEMKKALIRTAPVLKRIQSTGEKTAAHLQGLGINYDNEFDHCYTYVQPKSGHDICRILFALSDVLITDAEDRVPVKDKAYRVSRMDHPVTDTEDFYTYAAEEVVRQWNDLSYCPYCFSREVRMTFTGKHRCKVCRKAIKPFEEYGENTE